MRNWILAVAAGLALAGCSQTAAAPETAPVEAGAAFPEDYEGPMDILTVIDAGYPMYAVTARAEGYADPIEMLLNHQGAEMNGLDPDTMAGQTVVARVITEDRNNLMSMTFEGQELFASGPVEAPDGAVTVVGVLEGAAAVTASDLPDVVTLTAADGTITPLEVYVSPEMVPANGQTVTAFYVVRPTRSITSVAAVAP